jgi:M6 family metalloprotease-like protein
MMRPPERTKPVGFLGLTSKPGEGERLTEGKTDYNVALRPAGKLRAVMLFARFPDTTREETTQDLYKRLAPEGIAFMKRASYGKVKLTIEPIHRWIPMDHPSTWENYNQRTFEGHHGYIQEVAQKLAEDVDFRQYDIVYIVGSYSPGCPISPTFIALPEEAPKVNGALIRHAVTFGNDCRLPRWGWQTLAHETGHLFGLPDLYSYDKPTGRYKDGLRHVGAWDLMSYQAVGQEYCAWHKHKLEWLNDNDFWIAAQGESTVTIAPIYARKGIRAIVAPISTSEAYVVEVRNRDANPRLECGVLIYRVDLKRASGHGPIEVLPAAPDSGDKDLEKTHITLYNALYSSGVVVNDASANLRIEIIGRDGKGFKFRVSR